MSGAEMLAGPPPALQYGTVAISIVALAYLCGGRQLLGRRIKNDVTIALFITATAAITGFVVLATVSFDTVMGYTYGVLVGAALMRLAGKYSRVS